jgi:hypothetical protein
MLDLYFGEKAMDDLKQRGELSDEEEYFIGVGFPAADEVEKRLVHKGIWPAVVVSFVEDRYGYEEANNILWFRISEKNLNTSVTPTGKRVCKASAEVEILRGASLTRRS